MLNMNEMNDLNEIHSATENAVVSLSDTFSDEFIAAHYKRVRSYPGILRWDELTLEQKADFAGRMEAAHCGRFDTVEDFGRWMFRDHHTQELTDRNRQLYGLVALRHRLA